VGPRPRRRGAHTCRGKVLHRRVEDFSISENSAMRSNLAANLLAFHPEDGAVEEDVFPGRSVRGESLCRLPGARRAGLDRRSARPRWASRSAKNLQQVDLPGAVEADDADIFSPRFDLEAGGAERPKCSVGLFARAISTRARPRQRVAQRVVPLALGAQPVSLAEAFARITTFAGSSDQVRKGVVISSEEDQPAQQAARR